MGSGNPDPSSLPRSGAGTAIPNMDRETQEEFLSVDSSQGHGRPHGGLSGQHHGDGHPQRCQRQPPSSLRVRGPVPRLSHPLTTLSHPTPVTPGEASPNPFPARPGEGRAGEGRDEGLSPKNISLHPPQGLYQFSVVETSWARHPGGPVHGQDPDLGDNALILASDGEGSEAFSSPDSQRVEMGSSLSAR